MDNAQSGISAKKRYRPLWVILHWLMALLVFITFGIGLGSLAYKPNTGEKIVPLAVHMAIGMAILILVTARVILRLSVFRPPARSTQSSNPNRKRQPLLDQLSLIVHPLLYICTALMSLLGIAIALPANLMDVIFARPGASLPADFYIYPARAWHGTLSLFLMILIGQHVLVAIFHQFIKGENFLGRMWFIKEK